MKNEEINVKQFIKGNSGKTDWEVFVTDNGEVYQRQTYFESSGSVIMNKVWGDWRKRDLVNELEQKDK